MLEVNRQTASDVEPQAAANILQPHTLSVLHSTAEYTVLHQLFANQRVLLK